MLTYLCAVPVPDMRNPVFATRTRRGESYRTGAVATNNIADFQLPILLDPRLKANWQSPIASFTPIPTLDASCAISWRARKRGPLAMVRLPRRVVP